MSVGGSSSSSSSSSSGGMSRKWRWYSSIMIGSRAWMFRMLCLWFLSSSSSSSWNACPYSCQAQPDLLTLLEDNTTTTTSTSTFRQALMQTRLAPIFQSSGPFTVFAPDDNAFTNNDANNQKDHSLLVLDLMLQNNDWNSHLQQFLLYHVVEETEIYNSTDLQAYFAIDSGNDTDTDSIGTTVPFLTMLNGQDITGTVVSNDNDENENDFTITLLSFNKDVASSSNITTADLQASNGIVHVLNQVLVPSFFTQTVLDVLRTVTPIWANLIANAFLLPPGNGNDSDGNGNDSDGNGNDNNLEIARLLTSPISSATDGNRQGVTVFAPSPSGIDNNLLVHLKSPEGRQALEIIVRYHILPQQVVNSNSLPTTDEVVEFTTLLSSYQDDNPTTTTTNSSSSSSSSSSYSVLRMSRDGGLGISVTLNDGTAAVLNANQVAGNGIVHEVNPVLLPNSIFRVLLFHESSSVLRTLYVAVTAAALPATFLRPGLLTVFAPTNEAFLSLDAVLLTKLLTPPWFVHLRELLLYHVSDVVVLVDDNDDTGSTNNTTSSVAAIDEATLRGLETLEMVNGETITISTTVATTVDSSIVQINGFNSTATSTATSPISSTNGAANVTTLDIMTGNGIVHLIDAVLLPSFMTRSLVDVVTNTNEFSTMARFVELSGIQEERLEDVTIFVPSNEAFALLGLEPEFLTSPEGRARITNILSYHVVNAVIPIRDMAEGESTLDSLLLLFTDDDDAVLTIDKSSTGGVTVNGIATVIRTDVLANNGIIHVIDQVLLPPNNDGNNNNGPAATPSPSISMVPSIFVSNEPSASLVPTVPTNAAPSVPSPPTGPAASPTPDPATSDAATVVLGWYNNSNKKNPVILTIGVIVSVWSCIYLL